MLMCILSMSCKHAGAPTVVHYSPTVPSYQCTLPVLIFKIDYLPGYSQCQRGDHELLELQRGRSERASSLMSRHRGCQIKIVIIMNDTNSINPCSGSDLCKEAELIRGRRGNQENSRLGTCSATVSNADVTRMTQNTARTTESHHMNRGTTVRGVSVPRSCLPLLEVCDPMRGWTDSKVGRNPVFCSRWAKFESIFQQIAGICLAQ